MGLLAACAPAVPSATAPKPDEPPARRAILVSFDALSERRALETVPAAAIPNLRRLFTEGACADGARPAFPSVTAPGHAAIWTGAYGNRNGVSANLQTRLPRADHTLLQTVSGYSAEALRGEPLWLSAAEAGRRVVAHHVTQAPQPPGYRGLDAPEPALEAARETAARLLARPGVAVLNGYNVLVAPSLALTERSAPPHPPAAWRGLDALASGVTPLEITWAAGPDSVFGLLHGASRYDRVLVSPVRDVSRGTVAHAAPTDRAPDAERPLARHFASSVSIDRPGGRVWLTARLFDLAPDGSRFLLLIPELRLVETNGPAVAESYDAALGGWYGNGALALLRAGALGDPIDRGGDGTAEWRYLESLELMTRQFNRGSEWGWTTRDAALLFDYFPLIDEIDHEWLGVTQPGAPAFDAEIAARVQPVRTRAWALADQRLGTLQGLVAGDPEAILVVSGDHGMRVTWRGFRPNAALRQAGLLSLDADGRIDLARTRALSPNGYFVVVNRTAWRGGIVPPAEVAAVIAEAERALGAATGTDGEPIVTRLWRADTPGADTLGIGGPTGGDLYYETGAGYAWNADPAGAVTADARRAVGSHGFPSVAADMQTVLCVWGAGVNAQRLGPARTIDAAPTVAEWLGIRPPLGAVGRSLLPAIRSRAPVSPADR